MSLSYNRLTLNDLDNDPNTTGSLFVVNHVEGNVVFVSQPLSGGKDVTVKVFDTWVPQDLSTITKRNDIINSPDFRKLVSTRKLDVLATKEAVALLEGEAAQEENSKVFGISAPNTQTKAKSSEIGDISPKIASLVDKANSKEVSASDTLAAFRTEDLDSKDLQYIIKHCTISMLKKYAAEKLSNSSSSR